MALNASMTWMIRKNGLETNGGGFDWVAAGWTSRTVSAGSSVDYSDQDAPQLSITDLTSTNSTTATSVLSTFTAAMVGNVLRIASGTGATTGYYTVMTYVDANTITLDRVSGTYTAGVAKVGGAHADLRNMSNGGSGLSTPAITSPLAAGHTVYMRSAGSSADPSIAGTADYDYSAGYYTFPSGSTTVGIISFIGLGASESIPVAQVYPAYRPLIKISGLFIYNASYISLISCKTFNTSTPAFTAYGATDGPSTVQKRCIHDVNGAAMSITRNGSCFSGWVKNTGGGSAGQTQEAITVFSYGSQVEDMLITDVRGPGIYATPNANGYSIRGNIVANAGSDGFKIDNINNAAQSLTVIENNTAYNCAGHGFSFTQVALAACVVQNNTASKIPSTKSAFAVISGAAAVNDLIKIKFDYNNAYLDGGAGALYSGISAGAHDTNLDPQFVDPTSATWDFSIGTNLKAKGIGQIPFA